MSSSLTKLWHLLSHRDRLSLLWIAVLSIAAALLEVVSIGIVPVFVASIAVPDQLLAAPVLGPLLTRAGIDTPVALLIAGGSTLAGVFAVKLVFTWYTVRTQNGFLLALRTRLSTRLFGAYMRAPYSFHLGRNPAELMRNTNIEVVQLIHSVLQPLLNLLASGLIGLAVLALLLSMYPLVTLVGVGLFGGTSVVFLRLARARSVAYGQDAQSHRGLQLRAVNHGLGSAKEALIYGREGYFADTYATSTKRLAEAALHQQVTSQLITPVLELVAIGGLMSIAAVLIATGQPMAQVIPVLALFAMALLRLKQAVSTLVSVIHRLRYEYPCVNPVYDDLHALEGLRAPEIAPATQPNRLTVREAIELRDVTFSYPNSPHPVLRNISLTIPRGASVAFVGPTGAGKSTLADIILGLLTPDSGHVLVDGQDIRENRRAWQRSIGYIPQSLYLLDDTLRRNIAFGLADDEINDDQVNAVVRMAQLDEVVAGLPDGLDTLIGDRGIRLSGGQRQRVCIARALYHDPDVLILDEATSALDNDTERRIVEELDAYRGDRTLIVVAHRLSTVKRCDQLLLLGEGRVEANGTYGQLFERSVPFRRLAVH